MMNDSLRTPHSSHPTRRQVLRAGGLLVLGAGAIPFIAGCRTGSGATDRTSSGCGHPCVWPEHPSEPPAKTLHVPALCRGVGGCTWRCEGCREWRKCWGVHQLA